MLQCKCRISTSAALHPDRLWAFCYSNNELVIDQPHTHTHTRTWNPALTVEMWEVRKVPRLLLRAHVFTCYSCISLYSIIALLHMAASQHFHLLSFQPRRKHWTAQSLLLPPSICTTLFTSLSFKVHIWSRSLTLFLLKIKRYQKNSWNWHRARVYTWSSGFSSGRSHWTGLAMLHLEYTTADISYLYIPPFRTNELPLYKISPSRQTQKQQQALKHAGSVGGDKVYIEKPSNTAKKLWSCSLG